MVGRLHRRATAWTDTQVAALEVLARAMFVEVMELRRERRRALESRTLAGHAKNLLGYAFSAYCLYRCVLLGPIPVRWNYVDHTQQAGCSDHELSFQ